MGHQPLKDVQEAAGRAVEWVEDGKAGTVFAGSARPTFSSHARLTATEIRDAAAALQIVPIPRKTGGERRMTAGHVVWNSVADNSTRSGPSQSAD